ncbi:MAG: SUF system Fe-S cluster assembly protein [Rhodothalassiaceae bacterium]
MNDDGFGNGKKDARPLWSPAADDGYLDRFVSGETDDAAAAAAPESEAPESGPPEREVPERESEEAGLEARAIAVLRQIYDPEIPVNIYDLGLIYGVEVDENGGVRVAMTLTTPHCPVAETLPMEVDMKLRTLEGVRDVDVEVVWDPPWDMSRMSDEARLELGLL